MKLKPDEHWSDVDDDAQLELFEREANTGFWIAVGITVTLVIATLYFVIRYS